MRRRAQYARYPRRARLYVCAWRVLDYIRDSVVHSPVTSLSSLSRPLARSPSPRSFALLAASCLSPSFFDVILPCYYLDHRSRSAVREVAEKRDRDERRSRKEVSLRAYKRATPRASSVSIASLAYVSAMIIFLFFFLFPALRSFLRAVKAPS